ncbi:MAG: hypothetical protein KatS3mg109_0959 [Pirellulaceae bacterium]|nr:MAG: hypothetical protein KatS3mg109_0959 [Pirellulaceae bacterium]GIW94508.1 MAG: hypothetical protein KatS3mg110_2549 [Pirellulaceae bacterium]
METTLPHFTLPAPVTTVSVHDASCDELRQFLDERLGSDFTIWDGAQGRIRSAGRKSYGDPLSLESLVPQVAGGNGPEFVDECNSAVLLAVPIAVASYEKLVGVAPFAVQPWDSTESPVGLARMLGLSVDEARDWWKRQRPWDPRQLLAAASLAAETWSARCRVARLQFELEDVTSTLARTFEEISLLYSVTQRLRISATDVELGQMALEMLQECVGAETMVGQYLPVARPDEITYKARTEPVLLTAGRDLLDGERFSELVAHLRLTAASAPCVLNRNATSQPTWPFPELRELIVVPMAEGQKLFGWLAAFNHRGGKEFGTIEAKLMVSVATILGIHCGNRELYRQQAELLASVVRALVSAIDAKDPYTCGHSDRVARICVRLARELGCSGPMLHTIYMAGLLHDIGKIGIDDQILRKPGSLTPEEFEHIKQHPLLGYRILADIKQMSDTLPVVLHHHEQWNGKGYPCGLASSDIPLLARIAAVADAYDAMTSDRPYRKGMPVEKVEEIFRRGAGEQWDPQVIEAYFRCRDDILAISRQERANMSLDVESWFK